MTDRTAAQAADSLRGLPHDDLYEICSEAHKDVTGVRGRWMHDQAVEVLVSWYCQNFLFDEAVQAWRPVVPYDYEPEAEAVSDSEDQPDRYAAMCGEGAELEPCD